MKKSLTSMGTKRFEARINLKYVQGNASRRLELRVNVQYCFGLAPFIKITRKSMAKQRFDGFTEHQKL